MRRFGSRVTIVERGKQLAGREDPDVAQEILRFFQGEGIEVLLETELIAVAGRSGQELRMRVKDVGGERVLKATDVLVAAGRLANTRGLGLDRTGVELDSRGYIRVNERLQTTAPGLWAMGDCCRSPHFTHVAFDDFRVVRDNLKGTDRTTRGRLVPFCMFTDPELARVGLSESEAVKAGIPYRVARIPAGAVLRTRTLSETQGFLKALVSTQNDEILGFTALCAQAGELMSVVQIANAGKAAVYRPSRRNPRSSHHGGRPDCIIRRYNREAGYRRRVKQTRRPVGAGN
jgi:pyruvate/2-oxoglutarate dehydrogenase complex dihydrolipoamide dehydrogenase (E3) component